MNLVPTASSSAGDMAEFRILHRGVQAKLFRRNVMVATSVYMAFVCWDVIVAPTHIGRVFEIRLAFLGLGMLLFLASGLPSFRRWYNLVLHRANWLGGAQRFRNSRFGSARFRDRHCRRAHLHHGILGALSRQRVGHGHSGRNRNARRRCAHDPSRRAELSGPKPRHFPRGSRWLRGAAQRPSRAQCVCRCFGPRNAWNVKRSSLRACSRTSPARAEGRLTWLENLARFLRHELKNQTPARSGLSIDPGSTGDSLEADRVYLGRAQRSLSRMRGSVSSATEATSLEAALSVDKMERVV